MDEFNGENYDPALDSGCPILVGSTFASSGQGQTWIPIQLVAYLLKVSLSGPWHGFVQMKCQQKPGFFRSKASKFSMFPPRPWPPCWQVGPRAGILVGLKPFLFRTKHTSSDMNVSKRVDVCS